jgi:N-formylglutamate amidohydrolase
MKMIKIISGGPIVATAIHASHKMRDEVRNLHDLDENIRLREEDPYTDLWTTVGDIQITGDKSRFEFDINRPREKAVYLKPEDAWGLHLWKSPPPPELVKKSIDQYDDFYRDVKECFSNLQDNVGRFVVLDLHSYNQIRPNPDSPPADHEFNPEVIIGTSNMKRKRWAPLVDRLISDLRAFDYMGRRLDVRENVKWSGGEFSQWVHNTFPENGCSFAIEFKKFFMNEWTGELYKDHHNLILKAIKSAVPGIYEELKKLNTLDKQ